MSETYEEYMKERWLECEKICRDVGTTSNDAIIAMFNKSCLHYHYWLKQK